MTETNEYPTTDLYYAAFLQSSDVTLLRTVKSPQGRVTFYFDASIANIEELRQAWVCQTGRVVAQVYANCIKGLKGCCHT
jgi:acyl CoA:acetate/3-ketoacid CoA transferase